MTWIIPPRGLSISAIRKKDTDSASGNTKRRTGPVRCELYPTNRLPQIAKKPIRAQAGGGIRFHHAACVYACEFNVSFMASTASAVTAVGRAIAPPIVHAQ